MPEAPLRRLLPAVLILALAAAGARGQENVSRWDTVRNDARQALSDAAAIFSSPAHFAPADVMKLGIAVAGTGILMSADRSVREVALRNGSDVADGFAWAGRQYGGDVNMLVISAGIYGGGLFAGSRPVRMAGLEMWEAVLFAGTMSALAKNAFGRSRPFAEEGPWMFRPFRFRDEEMSLPSGHVTVAFAVSSVLAARLKNPYATAAVYSVAAVTALSRVYDDQHWLADTFLGAAIGTAVGWSVVGLHGEGPAKLSVRPAAGGLRAELVF